VHLEIAKSLTSTSLLAYSNGSLLDGLAGAGGVVMALAEEEVQYLRRKRELGQLQTVYVGESEGARMLLSSALQVAQTLPITSLTLSANNQAFLLAPVDPSPRLGQFPRLATCNLLERLGAYQGYL
jgi:hypothetical protein